DPHRPEGSAPVVDSPHPAAGHPLLRRRAGISGSVGQRRPPLEAPGGGRVGAASRVLWFLGGVGGSQPLELQLRPPVGGGGSAPDGRGAGGGRPWSRCVAVANVLHGGGPPVASSPPQRGVAGGAVRAL